MTAKAPVILYHPQDVEAMEGYVVILEVTADGIKPLYYQWYFEENEIPGMYVNYCHNQLFFLTGENKSFYFIFPVTTRYAGRYYCQVKNQYCTVDSAVATVIVKPLSMSAHPSEHSSLCYADIPAERVNVVSKLTVSYSEDSVSPEDVESQ